MLSGRLLERGVRPRLMTPPYLEYLYTNDRRDEVARLLRETPVDGPNRDAAPVCYQYAAMTWLSKFYPGLAAASRGGEPWPPVGAVRRRWRWPSVGDRRLGPPPPEPRRRRGLLAAGFIGMVLETVLLLRYQISHGIVYQQIGWLLTCFMAGMTAGRHPPPAEPRRGAPPAADAQHPAAVARRARLRRGWPLPGFRPRQGWSARALLLAAVGVAVGAAFGAGARLWQGDARGAASALYAADVAGGAVGAVAATLVLVPAAGLDWSALLMAALAAALFALIPRSGSAGR